MRKLRRRSSAIILAATCLLASGVLSGARALTPAQKAAAQQASALQTAKTAQKAQKAGKGNGYPIPPPGPGQAPLGAIIDKTKQGVVKAKVSFSLPLLTAIVYLYASPEKPVDPKYAWTDGTAYTYVTSPKGTKQKFGVFPTTTTHVLAFGTIPVSAQVHIQQITDRKKQLVPLVATLRFSGLHVQPPTPLPCSPPAVEILQCFYSDAPHLTGPVDVRIDHLLVDKVPVDVGSDCHTATPATLNLTANPGYYSNTTTPPYIPDGLYQPFVGGTLAGPVNVPAFEGCLNGSEDLSALVTGMVSGPGNPLSIHQLGSLGQYPPVIPGLKRPTHLVQRAGN